MAAPHVAGIVALMAQKDPSLTALDAENILVSTAIPLAPGCQWIFSPSAPTGEQVCWPASATGAGLATADLALGALP